MQIREFLRLSKEYNVVPIYKEVNADLDTPVSAFLRINDSEYGFLLESVEGQENLARYSFLGVNPSLIFKSFGKRIEIISTNKVTEFITPVTSLDEIKKIMGSFRCAKVKGVPRFCGGMVGFFGYDMVRFFKRLPDKNPDELRMPDALFMLMDTILVFDHVTHKIKIVSNAILPEGGRVNLKLKKKIYKEALRKIDSLYLRLNRPLKRGKNLKNKTLSLRVSSNFTSQGFKRAVIRAKEFIKKGEVIQVVLSQRFKLKASKSPFDIYRSLRSLNPSPYMYFFRLKDTYIVGASPEMLVRCEDGVIKTRPIAGTRPRGKDEALDKKFTIELSKDKKERSEHLMLVDLGKDDLSKVSKAGSVQVSEFMNIEKYSHVMHLVSEVKGILDKNRYDIYDVLKAVFPAGTVSGSPKIRAMEIIDQLENTRRGPYAGCVGYFSFLQNMDTCITIRTIFIKGREAFVQAGAGIVAESLPEKEYIETVNKAKALIEAVTN
jgi:anthranilate synthase component I